MILQKSAPDAAADLIILIIGITGESDWFFRIGRYRF